MDWTADSSENGSGEKRVVGDGAGKAKFARKIFFSHRDDFNVRHLILGDLKRLRGVGFFLAGGVRRHLGCLVTRTGTTAG